MKFRKDMMYPAWPLKWLQLLALRMLVIPMFFVVVLVMMANSITILTVARRNPVDSMCSE